MRCFISFCFLLSLTSLGQVVFAGQDGSESTFCQCAVESFPRILEWKQFLFKNESQINLEAQYDWPDLRLWPVYSSGKDFPSNKGEYSFFVDLGFDICRDESGKTIVERHSPDTSVYVHHISSGRSFAPFQTGPAGILHDVFWLDEHRLIILGMDEGDGVIFCVDCKNKTVTVYAISGAQKKAGASQEELIFQRLAPRFMVGKNGDSNHRCQEKQS